MALKRLWEAGECRQGSPEPTPLRSWRTTSGIGGFTPETVRLSERALVRARRVEGRRGSLVIEPRIAGRGTVEFPSLCWVERYVTEVELPMSIVDEKRAKRPETAGWRPPPGPLLL